MRTPNHRAPLIWTPLFHVLCIGILAGCAEDKIVTPPPPPPASDKATVVLNTITTGSKQDANGYLLVVDNENYAQLAPTDERDLTFDPGPHSFLLADLADNCATAVGNPISIQLAAGQRVAVTFQVDCPSFSSVDLTIASSGTSLDPDGYVLSLDGIVLRPVALNEQIHLGDLRAGILTFRLSSVAGNCSVAGGSTQFLSVLEDQTLTLRFEVTCVPRTDDTPGDKLVVSSRDFIGGDANLDIMETNGSGRQRLTDGAGEEMVPEFSPDGNRILFLQLNGSLSHLVLFDRPNRSETTLATPGVERAVWSPDGSRIAFSRLGRLYLMNADGSAETALTNGNDSRDPYWSPDGTRIAFSRGFNVYVVNTDGSQLHQLNGNARTAGPWSPDGRSLIASALECVTYYYYYCYYTPTATDFVIIDVATGVERPLTKTPFLPEWSPVWSRDGASVFFIAAENGNPDVFQIQVGSGAVTNLTLSTAREEWVSLGSVGAPAAGLRAGRARRP